MHIVSPQTIYFVYGGFAVGILGILGNQMLHIRQAREGGVLSSVTCLGFSSDSMNRFHCCCDVFSISVLLCLFVSHGRRTLKEFDTSGHWSELTSCVFLYRLAAVRYSCRCLCVCCSYSGT